MPCRKFLTSKPPISADTKHVVLHQKLSSNLAVLLSSTSDGQFPQVSLIMLDRSFLFDTLATRLPRTTNYYSTTPPRWRRHTSSSSCFLCSVR